MKSWVWIVIGPGQAFQCERRPRTVAAQPLKRVAIVLGDHDTRVQRQALAPYTQPPGATLATFLPPLAIIAS